jgi:putative tryptophan/tyrosine transport system substrate-binding protein
VVLALQDTRAAAQALELAIDSTDVRQPAELGQALSLLIKRQPGALILLSDSMVHNERAQIATFAIEHRLPSISPFREFAQAGGLMAYGPNLGDVYRRAVGFIDKILRGSKPADLPIQQPTKFELVINIKTAKALGLDVPLHLQQLADEVIE